MMIGLMIIYSDCNLIVFLPAYLFTLSMNTEKLNQKCGTPFISTSAPLLYTDILTPPLKCASYGALCSTFGWSVATVTHRDIMAASIRGQIPVINSHALAISTWRACSSLICWRVV